MDTEDVERIQEIEDFLNKKMATDDLIAFRRRLKVEPHLAEEVDIYRNLFHAIEHQSRKELKLSLGALETQLKSEDDETATQRTIGKRHIWSWASGIAASVLLAAGTYFWLGQSPDHDALFSQYYEAYPNVVASIDRSEAKKDETTTAFLFYEREEYNRALPLLQQLAQQHPDEEAYALYAGIANLETGHLEAAKNYFNQVLRNPDNPFEEQAHWYLALTLIKTDETELAKTHLTDLVNRQSTYQDKANKLLLEL